MNLPPWDEIAFDPAKDVVNRAKHGIGLDRATDLEPATVTIELDLRRDYGEERFIVTGVLDGRLHVMIGAARAQTIRVISLRRANKREVGRYEQAR